RLHAGVELAAAVELDGAVGHLHEPRAAHALDRGDHGFDVLAVGRVNHDLPDGVPVAHLDDVDGADVTAGVPDRRRYSPEHAGAALELEPQGHRELGAWQGG